MPCPIIPFPQEFRPPLPPVVGNVDDLTLRQRLEQIDALVRTRGVERELVERAWAPWISRAARGPTARAQLKFQPRSRRALRGTLRRTLWPEDYRGFSGQLAGPALEQWFGLIDALDPVRVPSKSEAQRFAHGRPAGEMRAVIHGLLQGPIDHPRKLGLQEALALEAYFLDRTALKANVHFPTDGVWLRDGMRTLMKATLLICKAGWRERMAAPEEFLRRRNRLSLEMAPPARRTGRQQGRKRVLRAMKQRVGVGRAPARRHWDLLEQHWERTEWTRAPAELSQKMKSQKFAQLQRRRAQTEGRSGILKHGFLGRPLRAKMATDPLSARLSAQLRTNPPRRHSSNNGIQENTPFGDRL